MSDKKDSITINLGGAKKVLRDTSKNYWAISTFVLAIVLVIVLINGSMSSTTASQISSEEAGQKIIDFINAQGGSASLVEVNENYGFYEAIVSIQGQDVPVYITKDGESFTLEPIPFDSDSIQGTNSQTGEIEVNIDSTDPLLGEVTAPITVLEYSDFECPFCERAYSDTIANLKSSEEFKNGEINLVFRHFPLNSIHPRAQKAAEASVCAQEQGKFWEYHDMLFENQNALDIASLKSYAGSLGLNQVNFDSCLDNSDSADKVNKDLTSATNSGGQGTPYFIILNNENGKTTAVSGAVPFSQIQSAIVAVK